MKMNKNNSAREWKLLKKSTQKAEKSLNKKFHSLPLGNNISSETKIQD